MAQRKLPLFLFVSVLIHLTLLSLLVVWTRGWFEKKQLGERGGVGPILFVNVGSGAGEGKAGSEKSENEKKKEPLKKSEAENISTAKKTIEKKEAILSQEKREELKNKGENTKAMKMEEAPGGLETLGGETGSGSESGGSGGGKGGPSVLGEIRKRIERAKRYPALARMGQIEGVVSLSFRIEENGAVSRLSLVKSSGSPLLDDEALATVRRSAPLPYYPETIQISLRFSLDSP